MLSAFFACTLGPDWNPPSVDGREPPPSGEQTSSEPLSPQAEPNPGCGQGSELAGCPIELSPGSRCATDADCEGQVCLAGSCQAATRDDATNPGEPGPDCVLDHRLNGTESDVDCGGSCPGCTVGAHCRTGKDCSSGVCSSTGSCQAATCNDAVENQDETGVDCGGACPSCAEDQPCAHGADCQSGVCGAAGCAAGVALCCQAARCDDGVLNGNEPYVDCGNASCGGCALGSPCSANTQCQSGSCRQGTCRRPPCADGVRNGTETDTDCGGADPACARCGVGNACAANADCASNSCINRRCADCNDGRRNGTETGVDCGGVCGLCPPGRGCSADTDCQSGACQDGLCCGGTRVDCTRCARRLVSAINCNSNGPGAAANCQAFLDCLAANPDACPVRYAPGCSDEPGSVCDNTRFGGTNGPGVGLADAILGSAPCDF
jgi:hypothetical protein